MSGGERVRRAPPPRDELELFTRAQALTGRTLEELAAAAGVTTPTRGVRTKGKVGELVEALLGADGVPGARHDFEALRVELKTVPLSPAGQPRESTFVASFDVGHPDATTWETSWTRSKLARVLWVPVTAAADGTRRIGTPLLWSPSPEQDAILGADFDEILGTIGIGNIEALDARLGRWLQARPKAAHGRVRTWAYGADGEPIAVVPRGFYLRASFTGAILRDPGACP